MLVLSRRPGEALRIGSELRIRVVTVSGGQVRLAIEAPPEIPIHREELYERIERENRESAHSDADSFETLLAVRAPAANDGSVGS